MEQPQDSRGLPPQAAPSLIIPTEGGWHQLLSARYIDTSAKLQDLSQVLDDRALLEELDSVRATTDLNVSLVKSEIRDKAGVDAATLAKNWGFRIEAGKRTDLITTQRGIRRMIHPSLTKRYKTNDRKLR
jgi:hypothetical protein